MSLPVEFSPTGGVNNYDNYARIGVSEVEDARNMLFQQQQVSNRPGLGSLVVNSVGPAVFADTVINNALNYTMIIGAASRIFYFLPGNEVTPAAGAAAFGNKAYNNVCSIIGVVVFGNNAGGLVVWDPTAGNTYALVPTAKYRYVCGHKGRAVACLQLAGGSALVNSRMFGWSKPGDVTVWTSLDGTAGQEAVADVNDEFTGIGVLHDIVVLLRRQGIHLAYPTGTLPLPYDVQSFILKGNGCFWPSTAAWSDEMCCMVGEDDVYVFDLQKLTPIGKNIRTTLINSLNNGVLYRGFITRIGLGNQIRYRYNLFPIDSVGNVHYIYDFFEESWSIHDYATAATWAFNFAPIVAQDAYGIAFLDNSNPTVARFWRSDVNCERAAYFTKYAGVLPVPEKDFKINDVLVRTKDNGAMDVTVDITGTLGDTITTKTATRTVGGANTGRWTRQWMSRGTNTLEQVGNDFLLTLSVPADVKFVCDYVGVDLKPESSGSYRGY